MTGTDAPQGIDTGDLPQDRRRNGAQPVCAPVSRWAFLFRPATALALLSGTVAVQLLTKLPPMWIDAALGSCGLLLLLRCGRLIWFGVVLVGAAWTMLRADVALSERLAPDLEGRDLVITGTVRGLPRVADDATRFDFAVRSGDDDKSSEVTGIVRLSWGDTAPPIEPCSRSGTSTFASNGRAA